MTDSSMALMELTDKCLGENDPNDELFDELYKALLAIENNTRHDNLTFWYYQYQILAKLGFKPDFTQTDVDSTPLPNPFQSDNAKKIFNTKFTTDLLKRHRENYQDNHLKIFNILIILLYLDVYNIRI